MKVTHIDTDGHEFVRSDQYDDIKLHETSIKTEPTNISWSGVRDRNIMTGTLKFLPHAKTVYSETLTRNGSVMISLTAQCRELPFEH
jgi:hypothetical protein